MLVAAVIAAGLLGADLVAGAADRAAAFTVGVLRRDAIVVPFATYDGRRWRADWPEPRDHDDVPVSLRSVPKGWWGPAGIRETWQAWVDRDPPRLLTVLQPDWYAAYCRRGVGLKTDYHAREPLPDPRARPYPTDGLVVSPPQAVTRIDVLSADDPARARVAPAIVTMFNRTEREIHDHPVGRAEREALTPAVEALYGIDGARVVYVEAAREYPDPRDPSACKAVAFGGGWFVRDGDNRYTPLQTYVAVLDCDRDGAGYMLPLGVLRIGDRTFWLAQFSGWDEAQYEVDEIKPKAVERLAVRFGGGC
jgi:hypothetical protein